MAEDKRESIYRDLQGYLGKHEQQNRTSAHRILGILFEFVRPRSLLDIGCGLGTWLSVAAELGIKDVRGVDGKWLDGNTQLQVPREWITITDLEAGVDLGRRFDLAICLEVGEHLSPGASEALVKALTGHSDTVLFSAAIPHQGGHHHVNEQFPDYWSARFAGHGFQPVDLIRPLIWSDGAVHWWLRQNIVLFAHQDVIAGNSRLRQEREIKRPFSVVHPELYMANMQRLLKIAEGHQKLVQRLSGGGTFNVTRGANGELVLSKKQD